MYLCRIGWCYVSAGEFHVVISTGSLSPEAESPGEGVESEQPLIPLIPARSSTLIFLRQTPNKHITATSPAIGGAIRVGSKWYPLRLPDNTQEYPTLI